MSAEARCQANRGINAAVFRKQKKEYDSFRFLKLFCVHFCWDGTLCLWLAVRIYFFFLRDMPLWALRSVHFVSNCGKEQWGFELKQNL